MNNNTNLNEFSLENKLILAKNILKKYNQEQLLFFYDELNSDEKNILLNQILTINFKKILSLYENSLKTNQTIDKISPHPHIEKSELSENDLKHFISIGEKLLKENSFAVITMAGGQGTRLGYKGPKGTYPLSLEPMPKSLFEIMCEDLKRTNKKYNITIPWYIMTSYENNKDTKNFFIQHNFFGYPKKHINFFVQHKLPIINKEGKLILQEPYLIKEASNGNGDVFHSMEENGIIKDLENRNIKWVSFGGIDNVLLKNCDPLFLGLAYAKNYSISSKSIFKQTPLENTAVYCKKNGKIAILDYADIDFELSEKKDEAGKFLYREANMLSHLMTFDAVKKSTNIHFRYHRAFKKNAFVNAEGVKEVPNDKNVFKFENFIFDAFSYFNDMLLLRVNENEEFAPIKDFRGIYNPDTAKEKYEKFYSIT